jgi:methyl-accepting chemotaxis protein
MGSRGSSTSIWVRSFSPFRYHSSDQGFSFIVNNSPFSFDLTKLGLGPRLGLLLGLAAGTALIGFLVFVLYSFGQLEKELEKRGQLLANMTGKQYSYEVLMADHRALKEALTPLVEEGSALAGGFYDKDGKRIAATNVDSVLSSETHILNEDSLSLDRDSLRWVETDSHGEVLVVTSEVKQGESSVGSVLAVLSNDTLRAQKRTSYILIGGVLVVVIMLGGLAIWGFRRTVEEPIGALRDAAREVESGNLDVEVQADQGDEIGELASSFNAMVEASREKTEAMEKQSAQAEQAREEAEALRQEAEEEQAYLREQFARIREVLQAVEEGDLTQRLDVEQDDAVGALMRQVNTMIEQLASLIREVETASTQLSEAAETTATTVEQLSAGAQDQAEQTTEVAAAVEEMSSTVASSSRHAERSNESAQRAAELAAEGEEVFTQTAEGMEQIADIVNTSAEKVTELGTASAEIGEIVEVIEDIADQTNLLALNAAIEAARAGEDGKGFAVVADEVRELAERTTSATQEIADMVAQIQDRTDEVVASMERGTEEVEQGLELAGRASEAFDEIVDSVDEMVAMIDEIAAATQQQSSTTNEIAENVDSISDVADEVSGSSNNLAEMAENMSQQAATLNELIEQFTVAEAGAPVDVGRRSSAALEGASEVTAPDSNGAPAGSI